MTTAFQNQLIDDFRAHSGVVDRLAGGMFADARLLLLTTTGARSGRRHTVPLGYLPDGAGRVLVVGSAGGAPRHPAWFHNLRAHPRVTVEAGAFTYEADAEVLAGDARDTAFARAVEADPGGFRRELALVRAEVAASGGTLGAQLRISCLTLCAGLGIHHEGGARRRPALNTRTALSLT